MDEEALIPGPGYNWNSCLNKKTNRSIEPAKEEARKIVERKKRMRQKTLYLCDLCDITIQNPKEGFIIHGNVYVANPTCRGGLIGNNFPEVTPGENINIDDINETVLCVKCLLKSLQIESVAINDLSKLKKMAQGVNLSSNLIEPRRHRGPVREDSDEPEADDDPDRLRHAPNRQNGLVSRGITPQTPMQNGRPPHPSAYVPTVELSGDSLLDALDAIQMPPEAIRNNLIEG